MSRQSQRSRIGMLFDRSWFNEKENLLFCVLRLLISQQQRRCCEVLEESLWALDQVSLPPGLWRVYTFGLKLTQLFPSLWQQGPSCGFRLTFWKAQNKLLIKLNGFQACPWMRRSSFGLVRCLLWLCFGLQSPCTSRLTLSLRSTPASRRRLLNCFDDCSNKKEQ